MFLSVFMPLWESLSSLFHHQCVFTARPCQLPFSHAIPLFNICQVPPVWAAPKLWEKSTITRLSEIPGISLASGPQRCSWLREQVGKVRGGLRRRLQDKAACILSSWKDIASRIPFSQALPRIILQHMKCWFIDKVIFSEDRCLLKTPCGWMVTCRSSGHAQRRPAVLVLPVAQTKCNSFVSSFNRPKTHQ